MDIVKELLKGTELGSRLAASMVTGAACTTGALVVLVVQKVWSQRQGRQKIQRARERREESLQRAEEAVLRYKETVSEEEAWRGSYIIAIS